MIPNDLAERRTVIKYMLDKLKDNHDELSQWEQNFVDSVNEQFEDGANLSDRQCEKLEQIYDKQ